MEVLKCKKFTLVSRWCRRKPLQEIKVKFLFLIFIKKKMYDEIWHFQVPDFIVYFFSKLKLGHFKDIEPTNLKKFKYPGYCLRVEVGDPVQNLNS